MWPVKTTPPTTAIADPAEFHVRAIPCRVKHGQIFQRWHELPVGSHFILVNDHDPIPLRYQFEAEFEGAFTWEYLKQGPEQFRVKIAKLKSVAQAPQAELPSKPTAADNAGLGIVLDARGLEPPEPLIRILDTLESLPPGKTLARPDRPRTMPFVWCSQRAGISRHLARAGRRQLDHHFGASVRCPFRSIHLRSRRSLDAGWLLRAGCPLPSWRC